MGQRREFSECKIWLEIGGWSRELQHQPLAIPSRRFKCAHVSKQLPISRIKIHNKIYRDPFANNDSRITKKEKCPLIYSTSRPRYWPKRWGLQKPFVDHLVAKKAPQMSRESPMISQADHSARRCVEVYLSPIASGRGRSSLNWKKGTYVNLLRHEVQSSWWWDGFLGDH
jgi:hypothetical protein